jgi:prefoldin alpha subunit
MSAGRDVGASPEQQIQDDLVRLEAYRNQLSALLQQHQILGQSRNDHLRARDTLDGLDRASAGVETLIPIGGETFVRGTPDLAARVLIGVGGGVVAEVERAKAREMIADRLKEIERAGQELEAQMRLMEERVQALSQRIETLGARVEGARGSDSAASRPPDDVGRD